jgi:DNA-directed RNA polymerase specialized sigma24 family protein
MGDFQTMLADLQRWHDHRDKRAFERFYRAYAPRAAALIRRALRSTSAIDRYAADALQHTFERLLKSDKAADAESFAYWDKNVRWGIADATRKGDGERKPKDPTPSDPDTETPKARVELQSSDELSGHMDPEAEAEFAGLERRGEYALLKKALARVTPASRIAVALSLSQPLDVLTLQDRRDLAASSGLTDAELETRLASHDPEDQDAVLALRFPEAERATPADRARCVDTLRVARARGVRQAAAVIQLSAELKGGGK